jgi:hypothetical protein
MHRTRRVSAYDFAAASADAAGKGGRNADDPGQPSNGTRHSVHLSAIAVAFGFEPGMTRVEVSVRAPLVASTV